VTKQEAERVWALMYTQWPERAAFRFLARSPNGDVRGHALADPTALAAATETADRIGWNSYVGMNPTFMRGSGRPSGADIFNWAWFLVDIDPIGDWREAKLDEAQEWVMSFLRNYLGLLRYTPAVIFSGRGRQLWFALEPLDLSHFISIRDVPLLRDIDSAMEQMEKGEGYTIKSARDVVSLAQSYWLDLMKERMEHHSGRLGWGVTIDTSVSDLPRVMRLPFTKNYKTGLRADLIEEGARIEGLGHKLIHYAPHRLWIEREPIVGLEVTASTWWGKFLPHMTVMGRTFLTEGASEGGRHKAAAAALLNLKELGCGREQTKAALLAGAKLCNPELHPREITPMIDRHFPKEA